MNYNSRLWISSVIGVLVFPLMLTPLAFAQQDWFLTHASHRYTTPFGGQQMDGAGIGLHYISMPPLVNPGQTVQLVIRWFTTEVPGSPIVQMSVFGSWRPYDELARLHDGVVYDYMDVTDTCEFVAPSRVGIYRIRWCWASAYNPITEFCGHEPGGPYDPGIGPWSEVHVWVVNGCPYRYPYRSMLDREEGGEWSTEPAVPALSQNYPNPFNPTTRIDYSVETAAKVSIHVYNVLGEKVKSLVDESKSPGKYSVEWDGTNDGGEPLAGGVYFYRLVVGHHSSAKKMIVLK